MGDKRSSKEESLAGKQVPRDAHAVIAMLKELGVTEYDGRVVCQLLEFAYRYVCGVLEDARVLAAHAKKKAVEVDDVRLAAQHHDDRCFTHPPPREVLLELTRTKNLAPLPLVKPHCGLRLPPDRYCLSACNYRLSHQPHQHHQQHQHARTKLKSHAPPIRKTNTVKRPTKMDVDGEPIAAKRERDTDDYDAP